MKPQIASLVLRLVGSAAVLFAAFGLWYSVGACLAYSSGTFDRLPEIQPNLYFDTIFLALSIFCMGCFVILAFCGIQFLRLSVLWLWLFIAVTLAEVLLVFIVGSLWISPQYGLSTAAVTGVSMGGLFPQLFVLFPLWAPVAVWFAKKSLFNAGVITHSPSKAR